MSLSRLLVEILIWVVGETLVDSTNSSRESTADDGDGQFLEDPSHVCRSCSEEYYTDAEMSIGTCRSCGGTKVEQA